MIKSKLKAKNFDRGQLPGPFSFASSLHHLYLTSCKVKTENSVKGMQSNLKLSKMKNVTNYRSVFFASVSEQRSALYLIETLPFSQLRDISFP